MYLLLILILILIIFGDNMLTRMILISVIVGGAFITHHENKIVILPQPQNEIKICKTVEQPIIGMDKEELTSLDDKIAWKGLNLGRQPQIANRGAQANRVNLYRDLFESTFAENEKKEWWNDDGLI